MSAGLTKTISWGVPNSARTRVIASESAIRIPKKPAVAQIGPLEDRLLMFANEVSGQGIIANVIAARDEFRMDLGGGTVAGANGSFGGLRREINWDGVPAQFAAPNALPVDFLEWRAHFNAAGLNSG